MRRHAPLACLCVFAFAACGESASPTLSIEVSPLTLEGVTRAEYRLAVTNGEGDPVWTRDVDSVRFGDGRGAISYVGPCDASAPDHTIALTVLGLYGEDGPLTGWVNPTSDGPLLATATCAPNSDVAVSFDLTLAREADQGFFDVAIDFEDLFCSAKVDCQTALLDAGAGRGPTAIFAFACTGGPTAGAPTHLYMDDVVVTCTNGAYAGRVDPSSGPGRITPTSNTGPLLSAAAIYHGEEALAGKVYWNVALGLSPAALPLAGTCTMSTRATAAEGQLAGRTAEGIYPYIEVSAPILSGGNLCGNTGLDESVAISTRYVAHGTTRTFAHELGGTSGPGDEPDEPVVCGAGYVAVDNQCVDIDECANVPGPCSNVATCDNLPGSYQCVCDEGTLGTESGCATIDMLATSDAHTCAIVTGGALYCWGEGANYRLGNASTTDINAPTLIGSEDDIWTSVAAGAGHTCALKNELVHCWGYNASGQVGDGTVTARQTPLQIGAMTGWTHLAAGDNHTCGIRFGELWCWGDNGWGQLGDGTQVDKGVPTRIGTDTDWTMVDGGQNHTCGLRNGALYCWGLNGSGQLGDGGSGTRTTPFRVGTDVDWTHVDLGLQHSCGVRAGRAYCWGANSNRQIGDGTTAGKLVPTQVGVETDWVAVGGGQQHSCGIRAGALYCWGGNNYGQLGQGDQSSRTTLVQVGTATGWHALSVGRFFNCGLLDGRLSCFGRNDRGQLGRGVWQDSRTPERVGTATDWSHVAASQLVGCGLRNGQLWCWGNNTQGQIGDGTLTSRYVPTRIGVESDWTYVDANLGEHTCGLRGTGELWCWGNSTYGQIGDGALGRRTAPVRIGTASDWTHVSVSEKNTCGIRAGELYCWGANDQRQLGVGTADSSVPLRVGTATDWSTVQMKRLSACGLRGGALYCWGYNVEGQVGDGTNARVDTPKQIGTATDWVAIEGGFYHVCGLRAGGNLYCWGDNQNRQVGDGTNIDKNVPTLLAPAGGWSQVGLGGENSCAVRGGELYCWGDGIYGATGLNSLLDVGVPTRVGVANDWSRVAGGGYNVYSFMCGLRAGALYCWGYNATGQLGIGNTFSPAPVVFP